MDINPLNPTDPQNPPADTDAAANLIRQKVSSLYEQEPDAATELTESENVAVRSKHQQYMHELSTSGLNLAAIQTAWHNYYQGLPAHEQHQVWTEFYSSQAAMTGQAVVPPAIATVNEAQQFTEHKQQVVSSNKRAKKAATKTKKLRDARSTKEVQAAIKDSVTAGGKLETKHHLQSLLFGLGMGLIVVIVFLFGFFNEVIIAPFIQPSRAAASTPLIVSESSVAASEQPEVIIPKINVQIPTVFDQKSIAENDIQSGLERGIVHYPTTALPGQNGNTAFFGHSSNNIFNKGKYKFAFVLLNNMVEGDTFYLTYNSKVYAYKVITKSVVDPSEIGVLDPIPGKAATATLITCDPPGTSLKRLVVVGEQISPNPTTNAQAAPVAAAVASTTPALPGNGPTLLNKFLSSSFGKLVTVMVIGGAITLLWRKIMQKQA